MPHIPSRHRPPSTRLLLALTALLCAASANSHAADAANAGAGADSVVLGLGAAYVPEYAGSDKGHVLPVPILERTWANGFYASSRRGLGYQTSVGGVGLSAALSYGGARDDHRRTFGTGSDALRGMGDIDGGAQAVLTASYQLGNVGLSLGTTQRLGKRENGNTYTLGTSVPLYSDQNDRFALGASAVYGDNKHAQTYFGVSAAQSLRSGYRAYRAKSGFETLNAAVNWDHTLDSHWTVHSAVGVTSLVGDAADSPLTRRKTAPVVMTGFSYKF